MQNHSQLSLIEHFKDLPDPRVQRTQDHDLIDILVIALTCFLSPGEKISSITLSIFH